MNISNIFNEQVSITKGKLDKFTNIVKQGVDSRTPEDTKRLLKNNDRSQVIEFSNKLVSSVYNIDTEYAAVVEYGVGKTFNYHKPKGSVFTSGVGAGMFRKTWFDLKDKFNDLT